MPQSLLESLLIPHKLEEYVLALQGHFNTLQFTQVGRIKLQTWLLCKGASPQSVESAQ